LSYILDTSLSEGGIAANAAFSLEEIGALVQPVEPDPVLVWSSDTHAHAP
jgi:hypothetical protein